MGVGSGGRRLVLVRAAGVWCWFGRQAFGVCSGGRRLVFVRAAGVWCWFGRQAFSEEFAVFQSFFAFMKVVRKVFLSAPGSGAQLMERFLL